MTTLAAAGFFTNASRTNAEAKQAQDDILAVFRQSPGYEARSTLTIATGSVTPTRGVHAIDTEAAAATDDLANIVQTNHPDGSILCLTPVNATRTVVVKHSAGGAGQISLQDSADFTMDDVGMWLLLIRNGALWEELLRAPAKRVQETGGPTVLTIGALADGHFVKRSGTSLIGVVPTIPFNFTFNGDFEIWGSGINGTPTRWTLNGAGASVGKHTAIFKVGTGSAEVTRVGADASLVERVDTIRDFGPIAWWRSKTVTLGFWVRATVASRARILINDGVTTTFSTYHSGGGAFEFLIVTKTIAAGATFLDVGGQVDTGDTAAQFDGAILVIGNAVTDFIPSGWRGRKSILVFGDNAAQAQGGTVFYGPWAGHGTEVNVSFSAPYKGVARRLFTRLDVNVGGTGQTAIATLRSGETTDTSLTTTINSGARTASDTTNEVEYAAGTAMTLKNVNSATSGSLIVHGTCEYEEIP